MTSLRFRRSAFAWRRLSGLVGAGILLALVCLAGGAWGQSVAPGALFRQEATLPEDGGVDAVAINADESILAKAIVKDGVVRVGLYDRPSRTLLGTVSAAVGDQPRLRFAPDQDLLLIAGTKSMQLWEVPIAPLKPDHTLADSYRRWEQPVDKSLADVRFGDPADAIYWTQAGGLHRRGVTRNSPAAGKPIWPKADHPANVEGFRIARNGGGIAVHYAGEKDLEILDAKTPSLIGTLSGHRFPVAAAAQVQGKGWVSLDRENNLIRWTEGLQQQNLTHLAQLPKDFRAKELAALGSRAVLLRGSAGDVALALVVNPTGWKVEDELRAPGAEQIALSPTGRYALVGDGKTVRLLGFAQPESPTDYVRRLKDMKALKTAQTYVRMLDEAGLPSRTKANLAAELNRAPPGAALQEALENLARARKEGNQENTRYWAEQVLNLQPRQPDALEAMKEVKLAADRAVLDQARQALEANKPAQAISLLSTQVSQDSPVREEANALIKQAEGRRAQEITLEQAREKLNLGDFPAAAALVDQVLKQDKENPAALSLQGEIASRSSGGNSRQWWAGLLGATFAALIMGFVWRRYRAAQGTRRAPIGPVPGAMPHVPRPRPEGPAGVAPRRPRPAPKPSPAVPKRDRLEAPAPERRSLARQQVVEAAQEKAEDLLRLARMADISREHTSLFMGLEAELSALRRRISDPASDLGPLHTRLKAIAEELRTLKFTDPPTGPPPEPPPPVVGAEEPTWYEILKVDPSASESDIKAAYLRLLKQYHPDLHNNSNFGWVKAEAERMSRILGQAFEVLSDAGRRQAYDKQLARERPGTNGTRRQQGARE